MRGISFRALVFALIVGIVGLPPLSYAAPSAKAGAACTKKGATQTVSGKKFTCITKGKKLVWNSGVLISIPVAQPTPTPTPTPSNPPVAVKVDFSKTFNTDDGYHTLFQGPCDYDPNVPEEWREYQDYFMKFVKCGGMFQLAKYELGSARPKTVFDAASNFSNLTPCKLYERQNRNDDLAILLSESRRRYYEPKRTPSPNTVIQLVPIYASDSPAVTESPRATYGRYLDFIANWIRYSSDFGSNVEVRIPDNYIEFPGKFSDYSFVHHRDRKAPENVKFRDALVPAIDKHIDFTGADLVYIVPPPRTSANLFGQEFFEYMDTNEGRKWSTMTHFGYLAPDAVNTNGLIGHPFYWLHETMHGSYGFSDRDGDDSRDITSPGGYGLGTFSLMAPWGGDMTVWEKWILGFLRDSQFQCATKNESVHWVAPSAVRTQLSKAVVVPVSASKVIVIESLRSAGLYYKIPKESQGAFVYIVDLDDTRRGMGLQLVSPAGRAPKNKKEMLLHDAPLKLGEHAITNGYKITVVESGTFGDVVRVEKV